MAALHIVNSSTDSGALLRCLTAATAGDAVLLIDNGVYAGVSGAFARYRSKSDGLCWAALVTDVQVRGLTGRLAEGIELVDDGGFVDLVVSHSPIVSWSA